MNSPLNTKTVLFRYKLYYIFLISLSCFGTYAQQHFLNMNGGYVETGFRYNTLINSINPIPPWQWYLNTEQQLDIVDVPVTLQGGFTSVLLGQQQKAWYPNLIRIIYKKDNFQKKLQTKYIEMLEQKAEEEYKKQQQKNQNLLQIKQINEWLSYADTSKITQKIDSLKQHKKLSTNQNEVDKQIQELENQLRQIRQLYARKELLEKQNSSLNVNDSILKTLDKAKKTNIDFKNKNLQSIMNMNNFQKLMYSLDEFKIGRFYLDIQGISEYTSIDGTQIKYKPKNFYIQILAGKIFQSTYFNMLMPDNQNQNNTYAIGTSIGRDNGKQNISIHYYYFTGNTSPINQLKNTIIGAGLTQKISKKIKVGFLLTGSQSLNTAQQQDIVQIQGVQIVYPLSFQNTAKDIITQNKSILYQTGYRLEFNTELKSILTKQEKWNIRYEQVSPFYQSMAMPYIMRDYHGISIQNQWRIFKNQWILTNHYQYREDNLSNLKPIRTYWTITGAELRKQGKKLNLTSTYQLIYRKNFNNYIYHNVLQFIRLTTNNTWQASHTLSFNILLNNNIILSQQYNYQLSFSPVKNWNITTNTGLNILNTMQYLNFTVLPGFQTKKWNIALIYQIMMNNNRTHQNATVKYTWNASNNLNFYLETGYGNSPQYDLLNNRIQFISYWNGSIVLRYTWN